MQGRGKCQVSGRRTHARRIDDDINVYIEQSVLVSIDHEFIVAPTPYKFGHIIEDKGDAEEDDKDGHEAPKLCTALVG